jgi:hypothetical protein
LAFLAILQQGETMPEGADLLKEANASTATVVTGVLASNFANLNKP